MKLTPRQIKALALIRDHGATGVCDHWAWRFYACDGPRTPITREVGQLKRKGLLTVQYYSDGAAVTLVAP